VAEQLSLALVARAGFSELTQGRESAERLASVLGLSPSDALDILALAADPGRAASELFRLYETAPQSLKPFAKDRSALVRLLSVLGGSRGLAEFLQRHPGSLNVLKKPLGAPWNEQDARDLISKAVGVTAGVASIGGDEARDALRVA
jgi:glutamate-ammonia-ligase adenylyltransferase